MKTSLLEAFYILLLLEYMVLSVNGEIKMEVNEDGEEIYYLNQDIIESFERHQKEEAERNEIIARQLEYMRRKNQGLFDEPKKSLNNDMRFAQYQMNHNEKEDPIKTGKFRIRY